MVCVWMRVWMGECEPLIVKCFVRPQVLKAQYNCSPFTRSMLTHKAVCYFTPDWGQFTSLMTSSSTVVRYHSPNSLNGAVCPVNIHRTSLPWEARSKPVYRCYYNRSSGHFLIVFLSIGILCHLSGLKPASSTRPLTQTLTPSPHSLHTSHLSINRHTAHIAHIVCCILYCTYCIL